MGCGIKISQTIKLIAKLDRWLINALDKGFRVIKQSTGGVLNSYLSFNDIVLDHAEKFGDNRIEQIVNFYRFIIGSKLYLSMINLSIILKAKFSHIKSKYT